MGLDYSKLKGKIIEKYGSRAAFAKILGCSERTLSLKMNGKRDWKQNEICNVITLFGLSERDIQDYFFAVSVQNF